LASVFWWRLSLLEEEQVVLPFFVLVVLGCFLVLGFALFAG
jgi:hypothetical protein